ncbi:MAG: class D sortase [Acidobacteriota bacterium]|nr:class D sortase [Acidobacteriota bacterium]
MSAHAVKTRDIFAGGLIRLISSVMIVAGFAALGYVAYVIVSALYFQEMEAAKFITTINTAPLAPLPKSDRRSRIAADGDVVGMVEIDSVGIHAVVVEGDSGNILRRAVGHVHGTPMPGEAGNVTLAAHRDTFFRPLQKIKNGDRIDLRTTTGVVQYRVRSTAIVPANDLGVLESDGRNELTLITCYPFYYVGRAPDRFVVKAGEIGRPGN